MAARLATAIESALDLRVELVEGHNGIYEIALDNDVVYTNRGQCSQGFPDDIKIVELIGRSIGVTSKPQASPEPKADLEQAPACPLPAPEPLPMASLAEASSGCGCGPVDAIQTEGSACCGPDADESAKKAGRSSGCC